MFLHTLYFESHHTLEFSQGHKSSSRFMQLSLCNNGNYDICIKTAISLKFKGVVTKTQIIMQTKTTCFVLE